MEFGFESEGKVRSTGLDFEVRVFRNDDMAWLYTTVFAVVVIIVAVVALVLGVVKMKRQ